MDDDLDAIEEALQHASRVPEDERGIAWQRYVDGLLDKRARLSAKPSPAAPTFSG